MPYIGYVAILVICLAVLLVAFRRLKEWAYPYILYLTGAWVLLMTSLAGPYLVGSDIHLEYFYAQLRAGKDVLQPIVGVPQGTSLLFYLTDNLWAFKLLYPLLFALVPVLLYLIFKKFFSPIQAFLASFFFIAFPTFSMELPGIVRQMVAEVFLVFLLYVLIVPIWKLRYKVPIVLLLGGILPLIHYAVALVALILLVPLLISRRRIVLLGAVATSIVGVSVLYFPISENGAVANKLAHIYNNILPTSSMSVLPKVQAPSIAQPQFISPEMAEHPPESKPPKGMTFLRRYENLILIGLGLDFFKVDIWGKVFRIVQWEVLILSLIGILRLRSNSNYWALSGGGILVVGLMAIPGFSNLLNITRFTHLALILLSPLVVVAFKPKYIALGLIPYFLFTSGFIFEVTKQPNIETPNIPYSVGLSSYRMDLGASVTKDDWFVRKYIWENEYLPIYSDIVGADFMGEIVGWRDDLHAALRREPTKIHRAYAFIREDNVKRGTFTVWNGVGSRKYVDPKEYYGITWDKNIIYQSGLSRLIWVD